jgi:hypothetical protein
MTRQIVVCPPMERRPEDFSDAKGGCLNQVEAASFCEYRSVQKVANRSEHEMIAGKLKAARKKAPRNPAALRSGMP